MSFRITDVVWVLFLLDRGYSLAQVGVAEGIFHITSLICEVPSGMVADLFGRKRTLILSGFAGIISSLLMGYGDHIVFIFTGMLFSALGLSMVSGTEEAIIYDSLLEKKQASFFQMARSRISVISRIFSTSACLFSPVCIFLGYRNVYLVSAALNILQIFVLLGVEEPDNKQIFSKQTLERTAGTPCVVCNINSKDWCHRQAKMWKQHVRDTLRFIKQHPTTMCKLLASAVIASPCYLTLMYLQTYLVECSWPESWIGLPMFLIPLGGTFGAWFAGKARFKLHTAAIFCGIIGGIGTIFAGHYLIPIIIIGAMTARFTEGFFEIIVSNNTNKDFPSSQRATLISIDGMLYSILMIVLSPITGILGERHGISFILIFLGCSLLMLTILGVIMYAASKFHTK